MQSPDAAAGCNPEVEADMDCCEPEVAKRARRVRLIVILVLLAAVALTAVLGAGKA